MFSLEYTRVVCPTINIEFPFTCPSFAALDGHIVQPNFPIISQCLCVLTTVGRAFFLADGPVSLFFGLHNRNITNIGKPQQLGAVAIDPVLMQSRTDSKVGHLSGWPNLAVAGQKGGGETRISTK